MYKIIGGDGKEYGPVDLDQIKQWLQDGRAGANTQVQTEGSSDWRTLRDVPELAALLAPAAPAAPTGQSVGDEAASLAAGSGMPPQRVPNYLVQSILCTLCCCLPAGIAAIVYAAQVNSKQSAGDYQGALAASKNAKMWCWISFGVGLPLAIIIMIFNILTAVSETTNY
jgi:hypothetical protein